MTEQSQDLWSVDAGAPLQSLLDRTDTPQLLHQTLTRTIPWQTRNETSVGRALESPRIAPSWMAALLALGATVTVEGEGAPSEVPLEELLQGKAEGAVSALHVPASGPNLHWGKAHVARTPADEPIVAAIAVLEMNGPPAGSGQGGTVHQARVALTGVWSEPIRLAEAPAQLIGRSLDEAGIRAVAAAVKEEVGPRGDFLGSAEYRRAMAGVLTRRALEACLFQEAGDE